MKRICSTLNREEWLQNRVDGIGGSDASVIMGLNNWKSKLQLWYEKTGQYVEEQPTNEAMYWGNTLENMIAQEFSKRTGLKIRNRNMLMQSEQYPHALLSVDREILFEDGRRGVLECKNSSEYMRSEWINSDGEYVAPVHAVLQVHHYLAASDGRYDVGYIAALVGGNKFIHLEIPRDKDIEEQIMDAEIEFVDMIKNNIQPELDGGKAEEYFLKCFYKADDNPEPLYMPDSIEEHCKGYLAISESIKEFEATKRLYANEIRDFLGERQYCKGAHYSVSWKPSKTGARTLRIKGGK